VVIKASFYTEAFFIIILSSLSFDNFPFFILVKNLKNIPMLLRKILPFCKKYEEKYSLDKKTIYIRNNKI